MDDREAADRYAHAANAGDQDAAGRYLAENLPHLSAMARWLARDTNGLIDPDDLAADTIASLLALWKAGRGPVANPNAYLIRAMRNRIIDAYRSPRSRVQGISDSEHEMPADEVQTRQIDLYREYEYIREALTSLPEDQQLVLTATVVEGRKPAELEGELDRSASAIYSLTHRAKAALRRATLRVILSENAPEECRRAATRLPETVTVDVDDARSSAGMEHIRTCARCRAAWLRFGSMATLGLTTLLVVGQLGPAAAPAQASEPRGERRRDRRRRRRRPRTRDVVALTIAVSAIVAGGAILVGTFFPLDSRQPPSASPGANRETYRVTTQADGDGGATLQMDVAISGDLSVSLTLPDGVALASAPADWECRATESLIRCELGESRAGTFDLIDDRSDDAGEYHLELTGEVDGREVEGVARGTITEEPQTLLVDETS